MTGVLTPPLRLPQALRCEQIESSPKRVKHLPTFVDRAKCKEDGIWNDLQTLHHHVHVGRPLPRRFYRAGLRKDRDDLLKLTGIKYLHLARGTSAFCSRRAATST